MVLGIDIGGTSTKVAVLDERGERVLAARSLVYHRPNQPALVESLRRTLADIPGEVRPKIGCVGVCAPGLADAEGRIIRAVNVPGIEGLTVRELVDQAGSGLLSPGGRVSSWTDAHAAAHDFAVTHRVEGRLLALSMGTGIGAAVLDGPDHRPLIVSGRGPGHLGQVDVSLADLEPNVPTGPDGGRGSAEAYLGVPALRARFGERTEEVLVRGELDPSKAPLAALVRLLRIAHAVYRPQVIAVLGGVGTRLAPVLARTHQEVSRGLTGIARTDWTLRAGSSDFHAAMGAARLTSG